LFTKKSDIDQSPKLLDKVISSGPFTTAGCQIVFEQSQISELDIHSYIQIDLYRYDSTAIVVSGYEHFVGSIIIPLFNEGGMMTQGHHLYLVNVVDRDPKKISKIPPFKSSNYLFLTLQNIPKLGNIIDSFSIACATENEPDYTDWHLPSVTPMSIIEEIAADYPVMSVVVGDMWEGHIHYSDHFKTSTRTPQIVPTPLKVPRSYTNRSSTDVVLSNWMAINGPVNIQTVAKVKPPGGMGYISKSDLPSAISPSPVQLVDYELFKDHPAAIKANRLHKQLTCIKILKTKPANIPRPNADQVAQINDVILQPVRALSETERELIVKYMWSLSDRKQALLKVLLALLGTYETPETVLELVENIINSWTPIDIDGALSLLGEEIGLSIFAPIARSYAVKRLSEIASPDEIKLFLYQLVQSLRYEDEGGPLGRLLIDRATKDEQLATLLYWYLECELSDAQSVSSFKLVREKYFGELAKTDSGKRIRDKIEIQCKFKSRLLDISQALKSYRSSSAPSVGQTWPGGISNKTEILREALRGTTALVNDRIANIDLTKNLTFPQLGNDRIDIPIPIDPQLSLVRIDDKKSFCIKSAKYPFVLHCQVFDNVNQTTSWRNIMFKSGDDLRQDQLVIQFISLIDQLLKRYGLDMKLSPYKVLATSVDDGFIEFVNDSQTLSSILANHNNDLLSFFRSVSPRPDCQYGVDPHVLDTFARSCAGYCAITYILGIGDRHLDNILVTNEGKFFHVDFGYILGRDPKPFPPPMKLCREMIEGMGGTQSVYYKSFVSKCTQAFLILRRHASLLVTLLYLAANSNIKDMREQDPAMAIMKVQKRLMPEVSDEVAEQNMINLINESTSALFPVVFEKLHKWAVYWRQ
jgi:phosphatidylinositol 3-kinase